MTSNNRAPCSATVAESFIRGAAMGILWGTVMPRDFLESTAPAASPSSFQSFLHASKHRTKLIAYSSLAMAGYMGIQSFLTFIGTRYLSMEPQNLTLTFVSTSLAGSTVYLGWMGKTTSTLELLNVGAAFGSISAGMVWLDRQKSSR